MGILDKLFKVSVGRPAPGKVSQAASAFGNGANNASKKYLGADMKQIGKDMKDAYKENMAAGGLLRKTDATLYNGYTGLKPSGLGNMVGLGAVGATAMYGIGKVYTRPNEGAAIEYEGEAPIMTADGMGSSTKAPTMNASGSLVFGLNNMRKG